MVAVSQTELDNLESLLLNTSGKVPLHNRFRALFTLKSLKNEDAIRIISKGMFDLSRYTTPDVEMQWWSELELA